MIELATFDIAGSTVEEGRAVYHTLYQAVLAHGSTADLEPLISTSS